MKSHNLKLCLEDNQKKMIFKGSGMIMSSKTNKLKIMNILGLENEKEETFFKTKTTTLILTLMSLLIHGMPPNLLWMRLLNKLFMTAKEYPPFNSKQAVNFLDINLNRS